MVVSTIASQLRFKCRLGSFCLEFACSPCACVAFLPATSHSPSRYMLGSFVIQSWLVLDKSICLVCLCWPCDLVATLQTASCLLPYDNWARFQPPFDSEKDDAGKENRLNEWMLICKSLFWNEGKRHQFAISWKAWFRKINLNRNLNLSEIMTETDTYNMSEWSQRYHIFHMKYCKIYSLHKLDGNK